MKITSRHNGSNVFFPASRSAGTSASLVHFNEDPTHPVRGGNDFFPAEKNVVYYGAERAKRDIKAAR